MEKLTFQFYAMQPHSSCKVVWWIFSILYYTIFTTFHFDRIIWNLQNYPEIRSYFLIILFGPSHVTDGIERVHASTPNLSYSIRAKFLIGRFCSFELVQTKMAKRLAIERPTNARRALSQGHDKTSPTIPIDYFVCVSRGRSSLINVFASTRAERSDQNEVTPSQPDWFAEQAYQDPELFCKLLI